MTQQPTAKNAKGEDAKGAKALQLAVILADQDQDIELAKAWVRDGMDCGKNDQLAVLWAACTAAYPETEAGTMLDLITRFAMIGIRHVVLLVQEQGGAS